jgi:uncharacterized protein (UPF0332 family)
MGRNKKGNWKEATKKKPPKPRREAIQETTDAEREDEAEQAIEKASIHLKEAEEMAPWGRAPNACVHAAYYAMHFVAVAALFRAGGVGPRRSVPESHEHVLLHYIKLAEAQTGFLRDSGKILNRARDMRVQCDYFTDDDGNRDFGMHGASKKEATEITEQARLMLSAWREVWES